MDHPKRFLAVCALATACVGTSGQTAQPIQAATKHSVCEGNTVVVTPELEMFGDFESGNIAPWREYPNGVAKSVFDVEPGGANGSRMALHWYGGPFVGHYDEASRVLNCLDVRAYAGVELWMKSAHRSQVTVLLNAPHTLGTAFGGDCERGCDWPNARIIVGSEWTRYAIPFAAFRTQPAVYGVRDMVMSMNIQAWGNFDLWVDEVRFYKGAPTPGATVVQ